MAEPDFQRDVHCVLGLPFDALTLAQAEEALRLAARERRRCFLSTPNLNFAIGSLDDDSFRCSVQRSDLSVADGWPIVLIARLLGVPVRERVAGSTLFEQLAARAGEAPMSVYFFGGPEGAAQAACERLNRRQGGLRCAGFDSPGFGSIDQMSDPARLGRINDSQADFLVVALGAKKGQAWIRHNLARLNPPVVSHLGAVVNFVAGTVSRAPTWVQTLKLEWLWRIKEEPSLWRRYLKDGMTLLRLLVTRVLPLVLSQRLSSPDLNSLRSASAVIEDSGSATRLRIGGAWQGTNLDPLRRVLTELASRRSSVSLDLAAATHLGPDAMGLLSLLHGWQTDKQLGWRVEAVSPAVARQFRLACAGYLLRDCAPAVSATVASTGIAHA